MACEVCAEPTMSNASVRPGIKQSSVPPWRSRLRGAREREGRQPTARWLQLATLAVDGTPRVRTLVFRGWSGPESLELYTDSRSDKADELKRQAAVELCWLLPKAKHQYRLRGTVMHQPNDVRSLRWKTLSPQGRALWSWPAPGKPFDANANFAEALDDSAGLPDHFLVLQVEITRVELLDLTRHPHERLLWKRSENWQERKLNP